MPTGAPNVIITDQDPAMTKSIAQVFPQTMHGYCLWHILNKFSEKLDHMTFRDHYQSIKHVIENSTTPDEFVSSWEEAMKCAKLEGNDWLQLMYDLRKKWVPAYLNHVFAAGMSSSQRSESSHSFFKSESHGYCVQQVSEEDEKVIYNVMHYQSSSSSKPKVFQLPDKYILNRWTQHAMVGAPYTMGEENISNDPEKLLISRHSRLSFKSSLIVDEASLTDEGTKLMEEQLDSLYYKIRKINSSRNLSMGRQRKRTIDGPLDILDPFEVRTKGCGKRLKSAKEKSISRVRQCHGCGLRGVSHDKRNCPNLRDGSTIDNQYNSDTSTDEEDVDP
ncbi:uncharacterized protein [Henckelia pumila]|uniref:uncharacterized protein n=1 Tax=Henckelia pumila TaxID=405737 RepID=UPI003C6E35E7